MAHSNMRTLTLQSLEILAAEEGYRLRRVYKLDGRIYELRAIDGPFTIFPAFSADTFEELYAYLNGTPVVPAEHPTVTPDQLCNEIALPCGGLEQMTRLLHKSAH